MDKVYKAILHCANKTDDEIRAQCDGTISAAELQLVKAAYDAWDGMECLVTPHPDGHGYIYGGRTNEAQADKEKNAIYLMEQDDMFGTYINKLEEFDEDWEAGDYIADGSWFFSEKEVELLEEQPAAKAQEQPAAKAEEPVWRCRLCGCTNHSACPGGCWWVTEDLCSACAEKTKL